LLAIDALCTGPELLLPAPIVNSRIAKGLEGVGRCAFMRCAFHSNASSVCTVPGSDRIKRAHSRQKNRMTYRYVGAQETLTKRQQNWLSPNAKTQKQATFQIFSVASLHLHPLHIQISPFFVPISWNISLEDTFYALS